MACIVAMEGGFASLLFSIREKCSDFYFLYNGSPELMSSKLSSLYSSLIFKSVSETEKISFVTTSEEEFALYLGKIPANLNLNLSVILIEENTLSVKKETWLHSTPSISDTDISHYTEYTENQLLPLL